MIKKISIKQFDEYAKKHELSSIFQTAEYIESLIDTNYDILGYYENEILKGAALIVIKNLNFIHKYGISPKGFLLDYYDDNLLLNFTNELKQYYSKKGIIFITINPEIAIGFYDKELDKCVKNDNFFIQSFLNSKGYRKKDNIDHLIPITNLKTFNNDLQEFVLEKYVSSKNCGLSLEKTNEENLYKIYDFIKTNDSKLSEITSIVNKFNSSVDIFFIKVNYNDFLVKTRENLAEEEEENTYYNKIIQVNSNEENLLKKMESDNRLNECKKNLSIAIEHNNDPDTTIGGIITIRFNNRVYLYKIGFNVKLDFLNIKDYVYLELFNYYSNYYDYFVLTTEDTNKNSDLLNYSNIFMQTIGYYDLIISDMHYGIYSKKKTI